MKEPARETRWYHYGMRMTWRLAACLICFIIPSYVEMSESYAARWREASTVAGLYVIAAWIGPQGKSRRRGTDG